MPRMHWRSYLLCFLIADTQLTDPLHPFYRRSVRVQFSSAASGEMAQMCPPPKHKLSQEMFDEAVKTNIDDFEMGVSYAAAPSHQCPSI